MDREKWLEAYRTNKSATWLKLKLTDDTLYFLSNHKEWLSVKEYCDNNSVFISEMQLQFRSHCVTMDIEDAEAIYFVPSVMGLVGGDTKEYYTVGVLRGESMHKKMWKIPEIIMERETTEGLEHCFAEAIIYNGQETETDG